MAGMSGWYYLLLGGLLEIVWAISTKARPWNFRRKVRPAFLLSKPR